MQGRPRAARAAKNGGRNSKHSKPKVAKFHNSDKIGQFWHYDKEKTNFAGLAVPFTQQYCLT